MSSSSIKCFAVDHRSIGSEWPYPYIRLGTGFTNDCALRDTIGESICTERFNSFLGEWTAMWWLWKHLTDFGKTDYVGMTQYRRFFTSQKPNYGPFPIRLHQGDPTKEVIDCILSPEQLLEIIKTSQAAGILPSRFPDYSYCKNCKNVVDLMLEESRWLKLGMNRDLCAKIFDILKQRLLQKYDESQIEMSFQQINTFHFNMFVLRRDLFEEYSSTIDFTVTKAMEFIDSSKIAGLHSRLFGYIIERLSSCIFFAMAIAREEKFIECPIILLDKKELG